VADLDKLLVYKLDAALAGDLEQFDLWLNKKIESQLRNEKTWTRSSRVTNGGADVENRQILCRVDLLKGVAKDRVEDVVDPSTTTKLLG
jgi:hypothetical protein